MALITLCPPAIAQGADVNALTRQQVDRERRAYYEMWGPQGIRIPDKWLPELDAEVYHRSRS
jgi:hypothetical protein